MKPYSLKGVKVNVWAAAEEDLFHLTEFVKLNKIDVEESAVGNPATAIKMAQEGPILIQSPSLVPKGYREEFFSGGNPVYCAIFPISASRIKAANCLHYFHQKYILGMPDAGSIQLVKGRFVHKVFEEYTKVLLKAGMPSDAELFQDIFETVWRGTSDIPESEIDDLQTMCSRYAEKYNVPSSATGTEVPFAFTWGLKPCDWYAPDVWLRAKIDRLDDEGGRAVIWDWKTNWSARSASAMRREAQAKVYSFALSQTFPSYVLFRTVYSFVRSLSERVVEYTADQARGFERQFRNFTHKILGMLADPAAKWEAMVGDLCPICTYQCPLVGQSGMQPIRDIEAATAVGQEIYAMKIKGKKLEPVLRNFVEAYGAVDIGAGVWKIEDTTTYSIKTGELFDVCRAYDYDPIKLLSVKVDAIKKMPDGELKQALLAIANQDTRQSLKFEAANKTEQQELFNDQG